MRPKRSVMENQTEPAWDGASGTAGGADFGAALRRLAAERGVDDRKLAEKAGLSEEQLARIYAGGERVAAARLARLADAVAVKAVEFMQKTAILSHYAYVAGLDPLYFLPDGPIRHDARIYMREINPRHSVPERDMLRRNPSLAALSGDELLDPVGKLELELTYLLRVAVQQTGGRL
jgi:transcriptional regulator with XRE-family HTH domain